MSVISNALAWFFRVLCVQCTGKCEHTHRFLNWNRLERVMFHVIPLHCDSKDLSSHQWSAQILCERLANFIFFEFGFFLRIVLTGEYQLTFYPWTRHYEVHSWQIAINVSLWHFHKNKPHPCYHHSALNITLRQTLQILPHVEQKIITERKM